MTRSIKALAALALAGASVVGVTSLASADPNPSNIGSSPQWVRLSTSHSAGVYTAADAGSGKYNNITLAPGDSAWADCWVAGGNVGNDGDVWYHTTWVYQYGVVTSSGSSWTFAPYVDGAAMFHNVPGLPHC